MHFRKFAVLFLALIAGGGLHGAEIAAVLSGNTGPYTEALAGLQAVVGPVDSAILPKLPRFSGVKVIVTFGSEAALRDYPVSAPLVAALLPDPRVAPKHAAGVTRVGLPPSAAMLVQKIKGLQGDAEVLAVMDPAGAYGDYLDALKTAASGAGLVLVLRRVDSLADLASKLPGLKGQAQALWVPPDPLFMNPKTFMLIANFCRSSGMGMYAPLAGLARLGALAGLAPSFDQQGRAAGAAAQSWLGGVNPGPWVYSENVDFAVNKDVAAGLGISPSTLKKSGADLE
jgi:hypothetical protein